MAIKFTKYINITSGVGGTALVANRELIARVFTDNVLIPPGTILEFTNASDVGTYFGSSSEEYARAAFYFSFVSKNITAPQKISYARWVDEDVAPLIFGGRLTASLSDLTAISDGTFTLTIGATSHEVLGLDFTGAMSLADVADVVQTEINTFSGTQWTAATVEYDSSRGAFNFVGGDAVAAVITVTPGITGTQVAGLLGWDSAHSAIFSDGAVTQTITELLDTATDITNNFGSFVFIPELDLDQITEAATWNATENVMFQYHVPVALADYADYSAALIGFEGTGVTVSETAGEYPEMLPTAITASTDYNARNSVQNFMFQQANLTASVTDTTLSNSLDAARINYYGATQTAGRNLSFYQRGFLMGGSTAPVDMTTYANEQWFKDAAGVDHAATSCVSGSFLECPRSHTSSRVFAISYRFSVK